MRTIPTSCGASALLAILIGLAVAAPPASAAEARSPGAAAVLACRSVSEPSQQLACFRSASDTLAAEQPAAPVAAAPVKRVPFGAPRPRPIRAPKAERDESVTVKVVSFGDRGDGRAVFHFDDGSTWVQTQSDESVAGSLREGDTVTLRRGAFSGYRLEIPGRSFIRVARMGGD